MSRSRASLGILPDDLYIPIEPWPRIGRPAKHDPSAWAYAGLPDLTYPFHDRDVLVTACGRL